MTITSKNDGAKTTFILDGKLDTGTAKLLQEHIFPAVEAGGDVFLDFSALRYVSSAGLRVLLMGEKIAKEKNATLTLTNVSEEVMEVFDMTGFTNVLNIM